MIAPVVFIAVWLAVTPIRSSAQERLPIGTVVGSGVTSSAYDSEGRRDPFVSLLVAKRAGQVRGGDSGLAGLAVADVVVKGVLRTSAAVIAVLEAPDGKSLVVRTRDRLRDGLVKEIETDAVVFAVDIPDAAGAIRRREVRKPVRLPAEDGP